MGCSERKQHTQISELLQGETAFIDFSFVIYVRNKSLNNVEDAFITIIKVNEIETLTVSFQDVQ